MSRPDDILVSCLTVTLPVAERFRHFQRCLGDYCRQTHPHRELVIALDPGPADARSAIEAEVAALNRSDIRIVASPVRLTLGALRNLCIASARGQILCQWDDDDLHHPDRVRCQLDALLESTHDAVYLEDVMQYFPASRTLYCTHWGAVLPKGMPGTLMCRRVAHPRYPEIGEAAIRGEDTAVAKLLMRQGGYGLLAGAPHLFVYVSHGTNTWPDDHHRMLADELSISRGLLRRREAGLREGLRAFAFGSGAVTVQGYNGPAFILETASGGSSSETGVAGPRSTPTRSA
ncbi:MAG: glycosyltransferase family A protein [Betaproteobacteria bacterium]